jgi:transposase
MLVPEVRGVNVSLISAINNDEVIYFKCVTGAVYAVTFINFMIELVRQCRLRFRNQRFNFILDNARIHHAIIINSYCAEEDLNLVFLSPYSYMLNPIEISFLKIKSVVRRKLSNEFTG